MKLVAKSIPAKAVGIFYFTTTTTTITTPRPSYPAIGYRDPLPRN
jgi:hypothetical protein